MSFYIRTNGPCACCCHDHPGTLHFMPCCYYTYDRRELATRKAEIFRAVDDAFMLGVVGYCPPTRFDEVEARRMICEAYRRVERVAGKRPIAVVSGLTNVGVLAIAYEEAVMRGWKTVGVACERAKEHPRFPVNAELIVGKNWGDESAAFVSMLDGIVRIGTGKQSMRECVAVKVMKQPTYEYDLPALTS